MKLGVLGHNIAYSLSPSIHQFWMNLYGLEGQYDLLDLSVPDFKSILESYDGLNITIPYKEKIHPNLEHITAIANEVGAVNTIYKSQGILIGDNTDYLALSEVIISKKPTRKAMILGNGGAAKAAKVALNHLGIRYNVFSRKQAWQNRHQALNDYDIIINATPVGLKGDGCPLDQLPTLKCLVIDMVYDPIETPLIKLANKAGHQTVDGLELLIRQAHHSFYKWWNIYPDCEKVREFLLCSSLD